MFHRLGLCAVAGLCLFLFAACDEAGGGGGGAAAPSPEHGAQGLLLAAAGENPAWGLLEAEFGVHTPQYLMTPSTYMDAAFGGGVHMLLWGDQRISASTGQTYIMAGRVSPQGVLLDKAGLRVSGPVSLQRGPVLAFNGTRFLAVWETDGMGNGGGILGRFIEPDGTLPGPAFTINDAANRQFNAGVGSDGSNFLVAWNDDRNWTSDIYGTRVMADGTVETPAGKAFCTAANSQMGPDIAFDGTNYLLAWQNYNGSDYDLWVGRVTGAGIWTGTEYLLDGGAYEQVSPNVVFGSDRFFLAWNDMSGNQIMTSRVTITGSYSASSHVGLPTGQYPNSRVRPGLAFSGDQYLVSWAGPSGGNEAQVRAARLGADGALKDPSGLTLPEMYAESSTGNTTVTWDGRNFLLAASNSRRGTKGIFVAPDGKMVGEPLLLSQAAGIQTRPAVAADRGGAWLAAMTNSRADETGNRIWEIIGAVFNNLGERIGSTSVLFPAYGTGHTVGYTGRVFLVASSQGTYPVARIQGRTLQFATPGEASPFELVPSLAGKQTVATLGCAPSGCLLAFLEILSAGMGGDYGVLRGARISEYGVTLDPGSFVIGASGEKLDTYNTTLAVAYSGTHYWVLRVYGANLLLTRVNNSGSLADSSPKTVFSGNYTRRPAVACAPGGPCLVAWDYTATYGQPTEIKALRVNSDGVPIDASPLAISGVVNGQKPSVAWNGSQFVLTWQDDKTTASAPDLRMVTIDPASGAVASGGVQNISTTSELEGTPVAASDQAGRTAILYERWVAPADGGNILIRGRFHLALPKGVTCTDSRHCLSGFCVDGVCCDSACGDGVLTDCLACNQDLGAVTNGTCGPIKAGRMCRASAGICDLSETCDGLAATCPADLKSTLECRPAAGKCDLAELCDGAANACPEDKKSTAECRPVAGLCDKAETCDGKGNDCPDDGFLPAGEVCAAAVCREGVAYEEAQCPGTEAACPKAAATECGAYACGEPVCKGACETEADCAAAHLCYKAVCVVPVIQGQTCEDDGQCATGHCADGFCCDEECEGQCEACDVTDLEGTCSAVEGQPHGDRNACTADGSACDGSCNGQEKAACTYLGEDTLCREASCQDGQAVLEAFCQGTGLCPEVQQQACAPFLCAETACDGDCEEDNHCAESAWCSGGVCVLKQEQGTECTTDRQCISGPCVDGYCCESVCNGQCESCKVEPGLCQPVDGDPVLPRPPCPEGSTCQDGACVQKETPEDTVSPDVKAEVIFDTEGEATPDVIAEVTAPPQDSAGGTDTIETPDAGGKTSKKSSGGCAHSSARGQAPLLLLLVLLSLRGRRLSRAFGFKR